MRTRRGRSYVSPCKRLWQEVCEFEASLGFTVRPRLKNPEKRNSEGKGGEKGGQRVGDQDPERPVTDSTDTASQKTGAHGPPLLSLISSSGRDLEMADFF